MPQLRSRADLPTFRYFPDPVGAEVFVEDATAECPCCNQRTGWKYALHPYAEDEIDDLCPWCIADGSAAKMFDAEFNDLTDDLPEEILQEINERTPEFFTWQQSVWLTHCNDAAVFVGSPGWDELQTMPDVQELLLQEGIPAEFLHLIGTNNSSLSAYVFQCRHCDEKLVYTDCD